MLWRLIPSKAALWAALSALGVLLLAWLRMDAKRDARRDTEVRQSKDRLKAIQNKKEIDRDVETQDDSALIERLTRR